MAGEHSPKGASSAERWMNCSGSAVLLKKLDLPQTDEPEYIGLGIAAHEVGERCLRDGIDTWEVAGEIVHGYEVDQIMADAVQTYLDYARQFMIEGATVCIEERIGKDPDRRPHPDFWGTADLTIYGPEILDVMDYKHGEGIVVEPDDNVQLKYYAYGVLHERISRGLVVRSDRPVRLHIIQPRAWHIDGPTRMWETTAGEIIHWAENELIPAMNAAEFENEFDAGKWCRFCPAKLFCPLLTGIFGAAAKADPNAIPNFSGKRLGLEYQQREAVKFYIKALEDETYRRNIIGHTVPGTKLVQKIAHRVWKQDTPWGLLEQRFGNELYEPKSLKSPAALEKLSPSAKKVVREWAYMPDNGLTVALATDRKLEVKVEKTEDVFAHLIPLDTGD